METHTQAGHFMDRVLEPLAASLNREAARSILDIRIDPEIQARVEVLAERANEGELTLEERDEYLSYVEAADLLAIFKLKARRHLEANGPPDGCGDKGTGLGSGRKPLRILPRPSRPRRTHPPHRAHRGPEARRP